MRTPLLTLKLTFDAKGKATFFKVGEANNEQEAIAQKKDEVCYLTVQVEDFTTKSDEELTPDE